MGIVIPHFGDVATEAQRDYRTKVTQLISLGAGICALSTMYLVPLDRPGGDKCASWKVALTSLMPRAASTVARQVKTEDREMPFRGWSSEGHSLSFAWQKIERD